MTFATSANCDQAWEPNTWCHGHVTVPVATQPGTYQVVWWWKYDRNPAGEEYSTCFEIVVGGNGSGILPREIEVKAQSQPEARIQMAANEGPRTFEMAYMTTSSEKTERDDSPVSSHDVGQQSLTELIAQPDEPLSEIPNSSIENDTKPMQQMTNGYVDDDLGTLAGDAINDDEDTDTSPLPVASPSQLVNTMLVEQMHANAGSNGNNPAAPTSKTNATINTSLTPSSTNVSSTATTSVTPASTTVGGSRDRNLVGQYPFDSSALTARSMPWVSVCTTLILSGLLALLVL
ncbi:hypothetical protein BGX28_009981 [Mortierella sp. GBA30]|nr:hypothetical protein BGX28_009981 [Mortierella sp. GBA30]